MPRAGWSWPTAIVLAVEDGVDAIVTIATLTGAAMRTFGTALARDAGQLAGPRRRSCAAAGDATDEPLWELPLVRGYRRQLDSKIADIKNMGGENAGTITAGLFLEDFADGAPFGHLDICGPMVDRPRRRAGARPARPPSARGCWPPSPSTSASPPPDRSPPAHRRREGGQPDD